MQDQQIQNPDNLYQDWSLIPSAHHNVRALCDLEGLNYDQKQRLTACVYQESGFNINAIHKNYARKYTGPTDAKGNPTEPNNPAMYKTYVASTDYGIVQINDYWHIGPDKDFPTYAYVLSNPEEDVRYMCRYYKQHGHLNAWCSWSSGEYEQWLNKV